MPSFGSNPANDVMVFGLYYQWNTFFGVFYPFKNYDCGYGKGFSAIFPHKIESCFKVKNSNQNLSNR